MSITHSKIAELLAAARARKTTAAIAPPIQHVDPYTEYIDPTVIVSKPDISPTGRTGEVITYNTQQQLAIDTVLNGKSLILIGAAGTGKTTSTQGMIRNLILTGKAGILNGSHKYLPKDGAPGIVLISFTRRAVANAKKFMPAGMENNCITYHKLMEYQPVFYEVTDSVSGETKRKMNFEPARHQFNPLSSSIHTIFIEESSMFSTQYWHELMAACPHSPQIVFLGDINQLPPVFGPAILGFKMAELPTVELTQVYRQALESPIIRLAHRILSGNPIPPTEFDQWKFPSKLTIRPWKKKISADNALMMTNVLFCGTKGRADIPVEKQVTGMIEQGIYDPETDMILIPFNKSFGTDELNKYIAQYLAKARNTEVYEIIAGFNKYYFSVGDRVLYDKEEAIIISIVPNVVYGGKQPQHASKTLDYWGHEHAKTLVGAEEMTDDEMDIYLDRMATATDDDRVRAASHVITVEMQDSGLEVSLDAASSINSLIMSYALTVHKSQGSEWRKVFLLFHQSHATMLLRELLYTAVTRAKEELYVICEPETFVNGIKSQKIKGNTLLEKSEYFKGKKEANGGSY